jgi:hypothetical protein
MGLRKCTRLGCGVGKAKEHAPGIHGVVDEGRIGGFVDHGPSRIGLRAVAVIRAPLNGFVRVLKRLIELPYKVPRFRESQIEKE